MNKLSLIILLSILFFSNGLMAQYRQRARHGYLKTETIVNDVKDPENNRRILEIVDKKGRLVQLKEFNEKGVKVKDLSYTYGKKEKTCLHKDANDSIKIIEHWKYDHRKRVIEYSELDRKKNQEEKTVTQYNKWGEKESEIIFRNQSMVKKRTFAYDREGMLIEQKTENPQGKLLYQKNWNFEP